MADMGKFVAKISPKAVKVIDQACDDSIITKEFKLYIYQVLWDNRIFLELEDDPSFMGCFVWSMEDFISGRDVFKGTNGEFDNIYWLFDHLNDQYDLYNPYD